MAFSFCWKESANPLFPALNERAFCSRGNGSSDHHKVTVKVGACTNKKENKIFLIYKEIQNGAVAKSYVRKGFLIYVKMRKY
jgi:hypothetical protein